jgi:uncharacterized protein YcnI
MKRSSVSLPRPVTRSGVVLLSLLSALVLSVTVATVASAHVTVSSPDATPGGYGKVTFRVPNESDTASTVGLRIQFPKEAAMASLRVQPLPGWTVTRTSSNLDQPIRSGGQEISSYVSVVEFQAQAGSGIGPGEFQEFSLSGGPFPEAGTLTFPALQVYSDGSETAWIEPSVEGQPEPEHPAPVLSLAASQASGTSQAAETGAAGHTHGESVSSSPGGLALFLSILALLVGISGVVLGWRAHRRTVAP